MTPLNSSDQFRAAVEAALAGNRIMARVDLESLPTSPSNQSAAGIWKAWLSDSPAGTVAALQRVLSVAPDHSIAKAGLVWAEYLRDWKFDPVDDACPELSREVDQDGEFVREDFETMDASIEEIGPVTERPGTDQQTRIVESSEVILQESDIDEMFATPPIDRQATPHRPMVLAIDDSPTVRKLVSMTLERVGYEVVTAPDGAAALDLLAERLPVLILLNIRMPRISGYKLCRQLKKHVRTRDIPVIMLSDKHGVLDKVRGQMAGCTDLITKPIESHDLINKVCQHASLPATQPDTPELVEV